MKKILVALLCIAKIGSNSCAMDLRQKKYTACAVTGLVATAGIGCVAYKNPALFSTGLQNFAQTICNTPSSFMQATRELGTTYNNNGLYCAMAQAACTKLAKAAGLLVGSALLINTFKSLNSRLALFKRNIVHSGQYSGVDHVEKEQEKNKRTEAVEIKAILDSAEITVPINIAPENLFDKRLSKVGNKVFIELLYKTIENEQTVVKLTGFYFDKDNINQAIVIAEHAALDLTSTINASDVAWMRIVSLREFVIGCSSGCYYYNSGKTIVERITDRPIPVEQCVICYKSAFDNSYALFYLDRDNSKKCLINYFPGVRPNDTNSTYIICEEPIKQICSNENTNSVIFRFEKSYQVWGPRNRNTNFRASADHQWQNRSEKEQLDFSGSVIFYDERYIGLEKDRTCFIMPNTTAEKFAVTLSVETACLVEADDRAILGINPDGHLLCCSFMRAGNDYTLKAGILKNRKEQPRITKGFGYMTKTESFYFGVQEDGQCKIILVPLKLWVAQNYLEDAVEENKEVMPQLEEVN